MKKEIASIEFEGDEASALDRLRRIVRVININQFVLELPSPKKRDLNDSYYSYNRSFGLDLEKQDKGWIIRATPFRLLDGTSLSHIEGVVLYS